MRMRSEQQQIQFPKQRPLYDNRITIHGNRETRWSGYQVPVANKQNNVQSSYLRVLWIRQSFLLIDVLLLCSLSFLILLCISSMTVVSMILYNKFPFLFYSLYSLLHCQLLRVTTRIWGICLEDCWITVSVCVMNKTIEIKFISSL